MAIAAVGCGAATVEGSGSSKPAETASTSAAGGDIGLSLSTLNNPFFVTLSDGAAAKAKELGVNLITVDAGDDSAKQASDIEDLISKNIAVLIVNPVDSDAVAPAVEDAIAKGIKVIAVDRVVNGVEVDCSIASDNVAGATMAAEFLVKTVGEGAKVAELQGVNGASATIDRGAGFHAVADTKLSVVSSQTANFNRAEGMSVMENMLQANPDVQCVFAHNDEMALGAAEVAAEKGIVIAGFDATDDALDAIREGKMAATVAQQPDLMGGTAVEIAKKLIAGETVEKSIPVEVKLITKDNVG
jgi:ribose transport system substrate-binding protein